MDLPTFGAPTIATSNPSEFAPHATCQRSRVRDRVMTPSDQGRSPRASHRRAHPHRQSRWWLRSRRPRGSDRDASVPPAAPRSPDRTRSACLRCASVSASMRSASPSICATSRRSIFQRAPREFARLRRPQARQIGPSGAALPRRRHAAMHLKFNRFLAGEARAVVKAQDQRLIQNAPLCIPQNAQRRHARRRHIAAERTAASKASGPETRERRIHPPCPAPRTLQRSYP